MKGDKKGINLNSAPHILSKNDHTQKNLFFPEENEEQTLNSQVCGDIMFRFSCQEGFSL